jgi:ATP-dependent RNA helicase DeaD
MSSFEQLNIDSIFLEPLKKQNIEQPTQVQIEAIPILLSGKDALVQSHTGTGKTFAYILPLLQKLDASSKELQAMVIAPTQELGVQIFQEIIKLTERSEVRALSLIGGAAVKRQIEKLKEKPHIVVGTPGRIIELIQQKKLKMHFVKSIVVDEVDQVFALGAAQDVERVISSTLKDRQLIFFSATITNEIQQKAKAWMKEPVNIQIRPEDKLASGLEHTYVVCQDREKLDMLRRIILTLKPTRAIIFVNETERIAEWVSKLKYNGLDIDAIYGEAGKQDRAQVMKRFREGRLPLLLSTDLAARGLDIVDVTHVFNFDPPLDAEHYVHRAGRTGRMEKSGLVISLITPKELFIMKKFSKSLGADISEKVWFKGKLMAPEIALGREVIHNGGSKGAPKWLKDKKKP